ncbi:hypothetical protein NPIL_14861 [Nephila pilipes]|uniref:Uncharacterized protein n=1 Tax=Nephila pilipes TaxID=299642 RepID=A0A8X6QEW6_NEPPI|nr:hypothetical protein NPIL_14861 [Nephila pilipes]
MPSGIDLIFGMKLKICLTTPKNQGFKTRTWGHLSTLRATLKIVPLQIKNILCRNKDILAVYNKDKEAIGSFPRTFYFLKYLITMELTYGNSFLKRPQYLVT